MPRCIAACGFILACALALASTSWAAGFIHGYGKQITGQGRNAILEAEPFTVPVKGAISDFSLSHGVNGFWITVTPRGLPTYSFPNASTNPKGVLGTVIQPGTYYAYPDPLPGGAPGLTEVQVIINCGGRKKPPKAKAAGNQKWKFNIKTPTGWPDRAKPGSDLIAQFVEPSQNAFLEVYEAKGNAANLQALADGFEAKLGGQAYVRHRKSSRQVTLGGGVPAVIREYSGDYSGTPIGSRILYAQHDGVAYVMVGVYTMAQQAQLAPVIASCLNSVSFERSPPMAAQAKDISGVWKTPDNQNITFRQNGSQITANCSYTLNGQPIAWNGEGAINGSEVRYDYHHTHMLKGWERDGVHALTLSPDGNHMSGTWTTQSGKYSGPISLTRAEPPAKRQCYEVTVKWNNGAWKGMHCFDWRDCSLTVHSNDGTAMNLARLEVKQCVEGKRFAYRGYYDHNANDPNYWSEADCQFESRKVNCVWHDSNGVSGTTSGHWNWINYVPPKRGAPGNRIGSSVR